MSRPPQHPVRRADTAGPPRRGSGWGLLLAGALVLLLAGAGSGWLLFAPEKPATTTAATPAPTVATAPVATPAAVSPPAATADAKPAAPAPSPETVAALPPPIPPAAPPEAPAPSLIAAPCPALGLPAPAPRCAVLRAPQSWARGDGPPVDMFVTVLPGSGPAVEPDPVLVLSGGPGQAGSLEAPSLATVLAGLRAHRDVVLIDQRGTGRSRPLLACPDIDPAAFWLGGLTPESVDACVAPVRAQGYRLDSFDTGEAARDLAALRKALGVTRWNLLATSYGAVLAAELVRIDGGGVRSLVLNSPTTARATWLDRDRLADTRRLFAQLVQDCAGQPACARAFPGLGEAVPRLAARLTERPLTLAIWPDQPAPRRELVGWDRIAGMLAFRLGAGAAMTELPAVLDRLERSGAGQGGDPVALTGLLLPDGFRHLFDRLAYGLNLIIGCRENRPLVDAAAARRNAQDLRPYVVPDAVETDFDVACPRLGLPPAPAELYRPLTANLPVLILTGAYDTLVPRVRVEELAAGLPRATVVSFRGLGHDVLGGSPCAAEIAAHFIDQPGAAAPEDCAERFLPPTFRVGPPGG